MVLKMLIDLERGMDEHSENFKKDYKVDSRIDSTEEYNNWTEK